MSLGSYSKKPATMDTREAVDLRADLLQLAKGLELQRAAVLSIVTRIEKEYHIERGNQNDKHKSFTSR